MVNLEGKKTFVAFKCEWLDGLCFNCGHFGHKAQDCTLSRNNVSGETPYGEWMRENTKRKSESVRKKTQATTCSLQEKREGEASTNPRQIPINPFGFGSNEKDNNTSSTVLVVN